MTKPQNAGPPMPDHLGPAGTAEWQDAVSMAEAKGSGTFPWQAFRGHVLHAAEQADLVAYATDEWEAAGRPLTAEYANGSTAPHPLWRVLVEARKAYGSAHGAWAGRAEKAPTTRKPGGQKGVNRAPDRVGHSEPPHLSGEDRGREALRLVREAGA